MFSRRYHRPLFFMRSCAPRRYYQSEAGSDDEETAAFEQLKRFFLNETLQSDWSKPAIVLKPRFASQRRDALP
ncbi:hypothetical protein Y032_0804g2432 [Ancylostoma ceylanicum]|uniref:Uncharacterized protein n=1 Tax=Ancylostoma ceylanicum TaxID=53326 RepID=A0A016WBU1_9BILA|nr:hypothetical protein Y032_0804g2432 [Ancylostoma ceylanicum]